VVSVSLPRSWLQTARGNKEAELNKYNYLAFVVFSNNITNQISISCLIPISLDFQQSLLVTMAFLLYKHIRKRLHERSEAKTAEEGHLMPNLSPENKRHNRLDSVEGVEENQTSAPPTRVLTESEVAQMKKEKHERRVYRWKMIIGLILPNFLAAVDVTIVAPAVPIISSHFSKSSI
jgi:hypothetical protein